jgi:hypothetical protein
MFAVAKRIQIFSNGFNFEFDHGKELGKICPTILDEDGPPDKTLFVLFLSLDKAGYTQLGDHLNHLNGDTLLFLKKLCSLSVNVAGRQSSHSRELHNDTITIETHLPDQTISRQFILVKNSWTDMPQHEKRPGQRTKTWVAFPYDISGPIIGPNFMYAFLPMQKMQFKVRNFNLHW